MFFPAVREKRRGQPSPKAAPAPDRSSSILLDEVGCTTLVNAAGSRTSDHLCAMLGQPSAELVAVSPGRFAIGAPARAAPRH